MDNTVLIEAGECKAFSCCWSMYTCLITYLCNVGREFYTCGSLSLRFSLIAIIVITFHVIAVYFFKVQCISKIDTASSFESLDWTLESLMLPSPHEMTTHSFPNVLYNCVTSSFTGGESQCPGPDCRAYGAA